MEHHICGKGRSLTKLPWAEITWICNALYFVYKHIANKRSLTAVPTPLWHPSWRAALSSLMGSRAQWAAGSSSLHQVFGRGRKPHSALTWECSLSVVVAASAFKKPSSSCWDLLVYLMQNVCRCLLACMRDFSVKQKNVAVVIFVLQDPSLRKILYRL